MVFLRGQVASRATARRAVAVSWPSPAGGRIGPRNDGFCKGRGHPFSAATLLPGKLRRGFLAVSSVFLLGLLGCGRADGQKQAPLKRPSLAALCPAGYSIDPSRRQLEPGIRAFDEKKYADAARIFAELSAGYPASATSRLWQGDAQLFDKALGSQEAARTALPLYEEAGRLHDQGCKLPRRPRYYHLMDTAYALMRLAVLERSYAPDLTQRALKVLQTAATEFPTSAEIPYTEARAHCAAAQTPGGGAAPVVESLRQCQGRFAEALRLAGQLQRPRFLRTHRSLQDWIVRSRTQSEFGPLRSSEPYARTITEALMTSPLPPDAGSSDGS